MAIRKQGSDAGACACSPPSERPCLGRLPDEPPILVDEPRRRPRSRWLTRMNRKLTRAQQAAQDSLDAQLRLARYAQHRAQGQIQEADIALAWGAFFGARAAILAAMAKAAR